MNLFIYSNNKKQLHSTVHISIYSITFIVVKQFCNSQFLSQYTYHAETITHVLNKFCSKTFGISVSSPRPPTCNINIPILIAYNLDSSLLSLVQPQPMSALVQLPLPLLSASSSGVVCISRTLLHQRQLV